MTNSLFKDSHITHQLCYSQNPYSGSYLGKRASKNERKEYSNTTVNKIGISVNKPADTTSFRGLSNAQKPLSKIYTSNKFKNLMELAADNQVVYSAAFALLLTCILRPTAIMALPSEKKNNDDKKYAAAQSIASGVIGFILSTAIATPLSRAVKKLKANPEKYMKNKEWLKNEKVASTAGIYLNKVPDVMLAVPKGILTIALIPPILKYVFGWEKKNKANKISPEQKSTVQDSRPIAKEKKAFSNFNGGASNANK